MKTFWQINLDLTALSAAYVGSNSPSLAVELPVDAVPLSSAQPRADRAPLSLTLIRLGEVSDLTIDARWPKPKNGRSPTVGDTNKLWVIDSTTGQLVSQYELEEPGTSDKDTRMR